MKKLTIEQARKKAIVCLNNADFQLRSCGNCNPAHKHLMKPGVGLISCFECGNWYYDGINVTQEECDKK